MERSEFEILRKELEEQAMSSYYWSEFAVKMPSPISDIALACKEVDECISSIRSSVSAGIFPSLDYFRKLYYSVGMIIRLINGLANEHLNDKEATHVRSEYSEILKKMEEFELEINKVYHQKKNPEMILPHLTIFSDFIHGQVKPLLLNTLRENNKRLIKQFTKEILYQSGLRRREEDEEEDEDRDRHIFDEEE